MRMRRILGLALVAVLVVALAGIAVAHRGGKQAKTEPAAAEFTAAPNADKTKTKTCTGLDGQYAITRGTYEGTSTGDPRLTGKIVIKATSTVSLTNGLGVTEGKVYVSDPAATTPKRDGKGGKKKFKAVVKLQAVNTPPGKLDGFLSGVVKNADGKGTTGLAANFSAQSNPEGTQVTGQLGGDAPVAPTNSAVFHGKPCVKPAGQYTEQHGNGGRGHGDDDGKHGGRHDDGKDDDKDDDDKDDDKK